MMPLSRETVLSKKVFVIEGNIGSGKSTLLSIIKNNFDIDIVFEPTDKWQKINGNTNLLDLFYSEMDRWSYTFQSYAFITRVEALIERELNSKKNIIVSERSIYCDRFCFGENCYESGKMSTLEWSIYKEWFFWLVNTCLKKPDGFIYLQASPETCFKRLQKRNRSEEASVGLDYLTSIHNKHENWLIKKRADDFFTKEVPVLVLPCDHEFEKDLSHKEIILNQIKNFINFSNKPKEQKVFNVPSLEQI